MRIGVLGGSFDPVHNAHLIVAQLAREQLGLDRVLFTVAAGQPHKQAGHRANGADRLRMVELATAGIPGLVADGRELRRPAPSYTIDTLQALRGEHPAATLLLIMGADVAAHFADWRDPVGIQAIATIAVCHRGSMPPPDFPGAETVHVPALDISSTTVRARIRAGKSLAGWVPPAVADYIVASQIYVEQ